MAAECGLCFRPTRNRKKDDRGDVLCTECRDAKAYSDSLTPAQQREEWESIGRHVEDEERRERLEGGARG